MWLGHSEMPSGAPMGVVLAGEVPTSSCPGLAPVASTDSRQTSHNPSLLTAGLRSHRVQEEEDTQHQVRGHDYSWMMVSYLSMRYNDTSEKSGKKVGTGNPPRDAGIGRLLCRRY